MRKVLLSAFIIVSGMVNHAQSLIAVEGSGGSSFYSNLDTAFYYAQAGDVIYIPGGLFTINGNFQFNKPVTMIGVGHYPDSTLATGVSYINGNIRVTNAASGGAIHGVYLNGNFYLGNNTTDSQVNGFLVSRSSLGIVHLSHNGSANGLATNIMLRENVIRGHIFAGYCTNLSVENNVLDGQLHGLNGGAFFHNNLWNWNSVWGLLHSVVAAHFENNIFRFGDGLGSIEYSGTHSNYYSHNVFRSSASISGTSMSVGNQFNVDFSNMYVNAPANNFSYVQNYHLATGSLAIGAGAGGGDCGIFGGANPYKEGAVPMNPHVISKNIAPSTNTQGEVPVNIKIGAQDR